MKDKPPNSSNVLASSLSGFIELLTFHPLDTITKRIINNRQLIYTPGVSNTLSKLNLIIFRETSNQSAINKYFSLFPGLRYAIVYKVSQRTFQFGGHPFVVEYLRSNHSSRFNRKDSQLLTNSVAGAIIGIGEVVFLVSIS